MAVTPRRRNHLEWILAAGLCILAAVLRFQRIDYAEFVWDQAHLSMKAIDMARGGQVAWTGAASSTGVDAFMAFTWLLAVPYSLSLDPLVATTFIAALNVASVGVAYLLARRWFGPAASVAATLLYAASPWAIELSRKIWPMEPMPLFTIAYAGTGWLAFMRGRRWALVAHGLLAAWLIQMHFSGLPVILISGVWAVAFRKRIDWRALILAAVLATLTFAPYLIADAGQDWRNLNGFRTLSALPASIDFDAASAAWKISTGVDFASLAGPDLATALEASIPIPRFLFPLEGLLIGLGLLLAIRRVLQRRRLGWDDRSAAAFMTATWLVMPILFQIRHVWPVTHTYFTLTYPAQFMLAGWFVSEAGAVGTGRSGWLAKLAWLVVAAIALAQIIDVISVYDFVTGRHTPNGFGTPLAFVRQMGETARRMSDEAGGAEIIVLADGADPRSDEFPRTADVLFYDRPHRSADVYSTLVLTAHPAIFVAATGRGSAELLLESLTPEQVAQRVRTRKGGGPYRFYARSGGARVPPMQPLDRATRWRNGISLIGSFVDGQARAGDVMRWALVWRIEEGADTSQAYHWFNHLLDAQGAIITQADGPAWLPFFWRGGDTVVTWFDLPVPAGLARGEYTMRVGMYEYPAIVNVPTDDGFGFRLLSPVVIDG